MWATTLSNVVRLSKSIACKCACVGSLCVGSLCDCLLLGYVSS